MSRSLLTLAAVTVLGLIGPSANVSAQARTNTDLLIESDRLRRLAEAQLGKDFTQAYELLDQAKEALDALQASNGPVPRIAAVVHADIKLLRSEIHRREKQAKDYRKSVQRLLDGRHYTRASTLLGKVPDFCPTEDQDYPFERLRQRAFEAIREGDRLFALAQEQEASRMRNEARTLPFIVCSSNASVAPTS